MTDGVTQWLASLGLGQYAETFTENDLDLELLPDLGDADLKDLGITSMGHRKKLLRAIAVLNGSDSPRAPAPAPAPMSSQAERRQLTVMFCDLVGSTELSRRLDPEDMGALLRRYQEAVSQAVARYQGHVAKFLGDGVLAYFGWPHAHEDQAERAIHAGLEAIAGTGALSAEGLALRARVGIASGLVVVGELAGEADGIVGETPNLAARLQGLAGPGEVVINQTTQRLVGGVFELRDRGGSTLKGFDEPVQAWAVVKARSSGSRFETSHASRLTPLVGRQQELDLLRARWRRARDGESQMLLLSGDAGIGKSRLLAALRESIGEARHIRIQFQCSPYHMDSAFHPIARQLEKAAGFASGDEADAKLDKLAALVGGEALDCAAVATLMALPTEAHFGPIELTAQQLKLRAIDVLLRHIQGLSKEMPILMTFEDLHWIDPSSQAFLNRIATTLTDCRLFAVMTHRPEYQAPFHGAGNVTALALSYLGRGDIEDMVRAVAGHGVEHALLEQIAARTDGIPLYVEEMTKSVTEAQAGGGEVPDTLQASLLSRLDRLGAAKEIAQIGAVIGRDFDYPLLSRVTDHRQDDLIVAIDRLVGALLVFQSGMPPDARYTFKHALVQDAAYDSLLKSRRELLHGRIAAALEQDFPEIGENEPEILARHHSAAGNIAPAIAYWRRAGERAAALSSGLEACNHIERALGLLESLPANTARDATELPLRLSHAWALQLTRGPANDEMGGAYARALELSETVGEPAQRFAAMFGLWRFNFWRVGPKWAAEYTDQLEALAEESENISNQVCANYVMATNLMAAGEDKVGAARALIAWDLFKASSEGSLTYQLGHNQGISSLLILAWCQWSLGQPSKARATIEEALASAKAMGDPLTLAVVGVLAAAIFELLGEEPPADVDSARALAEKYGFAIWAAYADTCLGWLRHRAGKSAEGLALIERGIGAWRAMGSNAFSTDRLGLYGRMCLEVGDLAGARSALSAGERAAEETGENFWLTEIQRTFGSLVLAEGGERDAAERYFRLALSGAEARGATGFALRAALDLARHLEQDGRRDEARGLLADIAGRFTGSDDTADLRSARKFLDEAR